MTLAAAAEEEDEPSSAKMAKANKEAEAAKSLEANDVEIKIGLITDPPSRSKNSIKGAQEDASLVRMVSVI
jgi:hypothetical protein